MVVKVWEMAIRSKVCVKIFFEYNIAYSEQAFEHSAS